MNNNTPLEILDNAINYTDTIGYQNYLSAVELGRASDLGITGPHDYSARVLTEICFSAEPNRYNNYTRENGIRQNLMSIDSYEIMDQLLSHAIKIDTIDLREKPNDRRLFDDREEVIENSNPTFAVQGLCNAMFNSGAEAVLKGYNLLNNRKIFYLVAYSFAERRSMKREKTDAIETRDIIAMLEDRQAYKDYISGRSNTNQMPRK